MYDDGSPEWANFTRHHHELPDLVWLYKGTASKELLYSVRSMAANLPHRGAWLVGDRPTWWAGEFIRHGFEGGLHIATFGQLKAACESDRISDPFVLVNDDMFLLEPLDEVPALHRGTVAQVARTNEANLVRNGYAQTIANTGAFLETLGYANPLCYELHVPMVIHKAPMLEALAMCMERAQQVSLGTKRWLNKRTMYGNIAGLGGERIDDVKVSKMDQARPQGPWLSTNERTIHRFRDELDAMFPEPCRHER